MSRRLISKWTTALACLERSYRGELPTIKAFGSAIHVMGRRHRWGIGLQLLTKMQTLNIDPDAICVSGAISGCGHSRQWQASLKLFFNSSAGARDAASFSGLLGALGRSTRWRHCVYLWELARSGRSEVITGALDQWCYNAAAASCTTAARWDIALQILTKMRSDRIHPDAVSKSVTVTALEKASLWAECLALVDSTSSASAVGAAISACGRSKKWAHSLQLLHDMGRWNLTVDRISFGAAIAASCRARQWEQSLCLLKWARNQCGIHPDATVYMQIAQAVEKAQRRVYHSWLLSQTTSSLMSEQARPHSSAQASSNNLQNMVGTEVLVTLLCASESRPASATHRVQTLLRQRVTKSIAARFESPIQTSSSSEFAASNMISPFHARDVMYSATQNWA